MNIRAAAIAAAAAATMTAALLGAPSALADNPAVTTNLGESAGVVNGGVIQAWTISGLKPSSDVIPYAVRGTLWEATATDTAVQNSATPLVSNFNARSASGENYRVLWEVATPQGVNPATLGQGASSTGKIYFDVTGAPPTSVAYNDGSRDLAVWIAAPPAPTQGAASSTRQGSSTSAGATAATGTPTPAGSTPAVAGSSGTPLPAGSAGTPAASSATPVLTVAVDAGDVVIGDADAVDATKALSLLGAGPSSVW